MEFWSELVIKYGYFGIFILLVVGIVGIPIPDEVLLAFVGYNVYLERMNYFVALLSAFSGGVVGVTISYILGLKLGLPFLEKFGPRLFITHDKIRATQKMFLKWGPLLLFFGLFIPGVRHVTAYLAGIASYRFKTFSFYAYSGAFLWVFVFITLGNQLGKRWILVAYFLREHMPILVMISITSLTIIVILILFKRKKRQQ